MIVVVNGKKKNVEVDPETPLLWVLREQFGLTGTKFGCGEGICGACTVLVEGSPERACVTPVTDVQGKRVVTIEGIPEDHPVKKAWLAEEVSQCGYCQPGQILGAVALLKRKARPSDADIDAAMSDHLCRCGTYGRIRRAIHAAAGKGARP
ncbi:MAG: (2Fe-2S)-binding protein [Deltaproteobacteria bacterium]|nr:(2Fe-2S)-binding protein [Deltaproteobacteria bacterium]